MGTTNSVAAFAAKIEAGGTEAIATTVQKAIDETALAGESVFLANMGVTRLRNVGRGAKVGARFDKGATGPANAAALLYYTGPAHLLNNPTSAHAIYPRGARVRDEAGSITKSRRRGGGQGLAFADGNVRLYANHPGTSGKHFFERSVPQVATARDRIFRAMLSVQLDRVF